MNIQFALKYSRYFLTARHHKGYGIHSPFAYELISAVLFDKNRYPAYETVNRLRKELLQSKQLIEVKDYGAGSGVMNDTKRKICDIARYSSTQKKYGELLFRLIKKFHPSTILELGASLGIGTIYLALPYSDTTVVTVEGCPELARLAKENYKRAGLDNIRVIISPFEDALPEILSRMTPDIIFFDGNHKKKPTLNYFEQCLNSISNHTLFVFDDIHWSDEMEQAWNEIKNHPAVTLTIDLFFMGLVFFRKEMPKQNFLVKY